MGNIVLTDELLEYLGEAYQQHMVLRSKEAEAVTPSFQVYVQEFMQRAEKQLKKKRAGGDVHHVV